VAMKNLDTGQDFSYRKEDLKPYVSH